jgi:hypothetical protein
VRIRIQWIAQNQLDRGLIIRKTQYLCLLRGHQQVHHRNLNRLPFGVLLEVGTGGENLDVLEQRFHLRSIRSFSGRGAVNQDVHALAGHDKAGHTDDVIGAYRHRSHSWRNGCGKPSTRTYGR